MKNKILEKVLLKTGIPDLPEILSGHLSPSELQSLMLEVYNQQSGSIQISKTYHDYLKNRFVHPSEISQLDFLKFDLLALSLLPEDFRSIELSPLAPVGTCSTMGNVSQKRIITTSRNTEVVADSTNFLTLECARRRKAELKSDPRSTSRIKLCSSHRLIRGQTFDPEKKFTAHFRIFSLCTAGRDEGHLKFETDSLKEHISVYLDIFEKIFINSNRELEFITTLEGIANENNIAQKINLDLSLAQNEQIYKKIPLDLNLRGEFKNLIEYLTDLESLNYYLNINLLEFSTTQSSGGVVLPVRSGKNEQPIGNVNLRILADTYWQ